MIQNIYTKTTRERTIQAIRKLFYNSFLVFLTSLSPLSGLYASHNASRYLPFLERPELFSDRSRLSFSSTVFGATAASAFGRIDHKVGIPELWGMYDLRDVITSLRTVRERQGNMFTNPFLLTPGVEDLVDRSVLFEVDGKFSATGVLLEGSWGILDNLYLGFSLPFFNVEARSKYILRTRSTEDHTIDPVVTQLSSSELNQVERVRLAVHEDLGIEPFDWEQVGFGDLDLFLRLHWYFDHVLRMRSINCNIIGGVVLPTSTCSDRDNPASVPFMGNGHTAFYLDMLTLCELKQDLKVGFWLSFMWQISVTRTRRLPVFSEPDIFSALEGDVKTSPGRTLKFSPYITFENILNGLHLQGRYTYLRHSKDTIYDRRPVSPIESYLTKTPDENLTEADIRENRQAKEKLSSWRAHYISIEFLYEPKVALKEWPFNPVFHFVIDTPYDGRGIAKTHQFSGGVTLRF